MVKLTHFHPDTCAMKNAPSKSAPDGTKPPGAFVFRQGFARQDRRARNHCETGRRNTPKTRRCAARSLPEIEMTSRWTMAGTGIGLGAIVVIAAYAVRQGIGEPTAPLDFTVLVVVGGLVIGSPAPPPPRPRPAPPPPPPTPGPPPHTPPAPSPH